MGLICRYDKLCACPTAQSVLEDDAISKSILAYDINLLVPDRSNGLV